MAPQNKARVIKKVPEISPIEKARSDHEFRKKGNSGCPGDLVAQKQTKSMP